MQQLCMAARGHDSRHNATSTDWWGHTQCQYYNEVQWSLASGSASIHSFLVGLLGLKIPLQSAQSEPPSVSIFGVGVALGAGIVAVPLPLTTAWPPSVARVKVKGMAVAGSVGLELSCIKTQSLKCQLVHQQRETRANELATSVAAAVQQIELEHPKPRGRPSLRRASTMSLGVDEDEAFSTAEDAAAAAAAAMSGLSGAENLDSERDQFSQTMTFGGSDDEGEGGAEY